MKLHALALLLATVSGFAWLHNNTIASEPSEVFSVWPGAAPDQSRNVGEERIVEGRSRPFYQITGVSKPTVSVYLPSKVHRTGASILLCPGGGLQRLAIEHEGFEVADWLLSQNITVFLLKYRVPAPVKSGLQDAQRALSLIRSRSGDWGIDPNGIGVLGFSAGGEIAAWLSTHYGRSYSWIGLAPRVFSTRPMFENTNGHFQAHWRQAVHCRDSRRKSPAQLPRMRMSPKSDLRAVHLKTIASPDSKGPGRPQKPSEAWE
ncbi:MAG: alpha/beta hydrolase [Verrucomicrobia bacterium]|nr:alpha/beta hydrolase [Verrucomicrobiota bacterium]